MIVPARPAAERMAAGILAMLAFCAVLMLQPWLGVSLIGRPWPLGIAVALALIGGAIRRGTAVRLPPLRPAPLLVWAGASVAVTLPAWWSPTSVTYSTDMLWHQGWIRELMAGDPAPTGGLYDSVPNAYPWLYHALSAVIAGVLPGGVIDSLLVVELAGLAALGLGMWLVCQELDFGEGAACWAIGIAVAGGGIGWLWARGPAAVTLQISAASHRFHGDLLVGNAPTAGLGNVFPLLPRELGIDLVPLAVWLGLRTRQTPRAGWAAGAATGFVGLISPTAAIGALVVQLALTASRRPVAFRAGVRMLVSFGMVVAIWVIPLAVHAHRLGGLVNTSLTAPLSPSPVEVLVAFGLLTPLAAIGLAIEHRREMLLIAAAPLAVILVAAVVSGAGLPGGPALTRSLRYLPLLGLGCCPAAGFGADLLVRRSGRAASATRAVLAAALVASPLLASIDLAAASHPWVGRDALECRPALPANANDTVAAVRLTPFLTDRLSIQVFAQTGAAAAWAALPRVRYTNPPIPSDATRRGWLRALASNRGQTGPVDLALSQTPLPGARRGGTCLLTVSVVGRLPSGSGGRSVRLEWFRVTGDRVS